MFLGIVALAWPLSSLLPIASKTPTGIHLGWKPLLIAALAPALVTPLILWKMPTDFLPILLGDYLTLHFLLYGALTTTGHAVPAQGAICGCRDDRVLEEHRDRDSRCRRLQHCRFRPARSTPTSSRSCQSPRGFR